MPEVLLAKMTWPEVKARLTETDVVLLPTGAIEQHGHHLPLDVDIYIAEQLAIRMAQAVADDVKAVVAPGMAIGASAASLPFPGSLTLDEITLLQVWTQTIKCLGQHGFKKVIIVNGHGGNRALISTLMSRIHRETGIFLAYFDWLTPNSQLIEAMLEAESGQWGHACEMETSLYMALGGRAEMDRATNEVLEVQPSLRDYWPFNRPKVRIAFSHTFDEWPPDQWSGVLGDARLSSLEKGQRLLDATLAVGVQLVRNVSSVSVTLKPFDFP